MKKSERLLMNSALNLGGNAIPLLAGIIFIPSIIKGMGIERFGILSLCWVLFSYFGIFDLGISRAAIKFISEADAAGDRGKITRIFWTSFYSQIIIGLIIGLLAYWAIPYLVQNILRMPPHLLTETITSFRVLVLMLPVILVSSGVKNLLEALQRFDIVNYIKLPSNVLFFIIPAIYSGRNLYFIILMLGMVRFFSGGLYGVFAAKILPELLRDTNFHPEAFKNIFSMGLWITISSIVSPVLLYVERFFITSLASVSALSYYSVSYDMLSRLTLIAVSAAAALYPAFSFENATPNGKTSDLLIRPLKYLMIIMTPVVIVLYVFSDIILLKWLGADFLKNGIVIFRILLITFYINSLAVIPFMAVQGLGRADIKAKFDVIASIIFIIGVYLLVKNFEATGAAWGKLMLISTDFIFLLLVSLKLSRQKSTSIGSSNLLIKTSIYSTIFIILAIFATKLIAGITSQKQILTLSAAAAAILSFGYFYLSYKILIDSIDKNTFTNFIGGIINLKNS